MDCHEYISNHLAAHADNELSAQERRAAEEHVGGCVVCRARLIESRSLKALVRQNAGIVRAPADLRLRIRAALGDAAERETREQPAIGLQARRGAAGEASARIARRIARRPLWASAGLAASLLVIVALAGGRAGHLGGTAHRADAVPAFDAAINKYLAMQRSFIPNVPAEPFSSHDGTLYAWVVNRDPVTRAATEASDTFHDVARSYREAEMPEDIFDFTPAGYELSGGRVDSLPDGRPVTYTLYRSQIDSLLNICYPDPTFAAPIGAIQWFGMRSFYEYQGYSICVSFYPAGHFVSILISRVPVQQLLRYVATTDVAVLDHGK